MNKIFTQNHGLYGLYGFHGVRLAITLFLTALLAVGNVTAQEKKVTIHGNVFGGGNEAPVGGSVTVNMTGGQIGDTQIDAEHGNVYGGGAKAHTNTANPSGNTSTYTTTVNLKGGTIKGDAYGGGLGDLAAVGTGHSDIEATVHGDITVNLGDADSEVAATKFIINNYNDNTDTDDVDESKIVKSGRVFGCNNLNGSPLGNVTVHVYRTIGNAERTAVGDLKDDSKIHTYDVAAVYGGGNLANYTAASGKKANVIIHTCDVSVESVYGGGNAAAVPETDVLISGAYEIGYVFGGGNGKDPYTLNGSSWIPNGGANVGVYNDGTGDVTIGTGNANTLLTGGFIHEAYGASNQKGTIKGSAMLRADDAGAEGCALDVIKLVGAGKNADIDGDAILIMGCMPETKIDQVFGGADNANVNGNVELTITSGNFRQVFGGNNLSGMIKGHIKVNIEETGCRAINIDELYLGGNQAAYSIYGYYDSGSTNDAGKPIYIGRESEDDNTGTPIYTPAISDDNHPFPYAQPELNVISCTRIGQVFGGGLGSGAAMHASPTVNVNMLPGRYAANIDRNDDSSADGNAHALGSVVDVYGGGKEAYVYGTTKVNVGTAAKVYYTSEPTYLGTKNTDYTEVTGDDDPHKGQYEATAEGARITGNVYGGGLAANVDGNTEVNVGTVAYTTEGFEKVTIAGDVYGGGEGHTTDVTGTAQVNLGADGVGNSTVSGDIYGGSAFGTVGTSDVKLYHGTASKNVFGGGKGQLEFGVAETEGYKAPYSATITTSATVSLLGATVTEDIYGGCNVNGTAATTTVKLLGGSAHDAFGGGLGENTSVTNDVLVEVGQYDADAETKISGNATVHDVYGGSAKGKVNNADAGIANDDTQAKTKHTYVNLYAGTVTGDVYGGGLGYIDDEDHDNDIEAIVYGDVAVKLNENNGTASVGGRVFGCNNLKGTPKGVVTVEVYGTSRKDSDGNVIATKPDRIGDPEPASDPKPLAYLTVTDTQVDGQTYELAGVFGGGNQAAYAPTNSSSVTTVNIHGCETTSIKEVYGGGNAADVTNCAVNIYGAWEIGYVYGGGNGTTDVAANVTGNAETTINGGTIYRTFGGSNTNGDIGASTLNIEDGDNEDVCKQPKLGDVFSYGNRAEMSNPATVSLGCLENKVGALYGGAMNANIGNDITLNINGGKYAKVFGGNKSGGIIGGAIKVNVEQTVCDVEIDELYGCGNAAPYTTAYTDGETPAHYADPEVNIISCTSIGAVFGGGYGADAIVTGNPKVNINMIKATAGEHTSALGTIGYVYGGGNAAAVTGNPIVNIGTLTDLSDNDTKPVLGANITGKVFGGGCSADVDGSTTVNIGTVNYTVSGDVIGITIGDDVYGAGEGNTTNVTGTATVNLGTDGLGNTTLSHDIYGGSAFGSAENTVVHLYSGSVANVFGGGKGQLASGDDAAYVAAIGTKATVMLHAATITGEVYGGCNVNGTTEVAELNLLGGTIGTSGSVGEKVFGGGKGHATTTNTATVNVGSDTSTGSSSIYSNVYGGSALGAVGTAIVNLNHVTTLTGHVFGGGMGEGTSDDTKATITTSATVNQNGITLAADKDIYGGCNINGTAAATYVYVLGGTVNDVFGGGLGQHTGVTGNVLVEVGHFNGTNAVSGTATVTHDVYGGSAKGAVNSNTSNTTTVNLWKGTINGDVYGGGLGDKTSMGEGHADIAAVVNGNVRVNLNGYDDESTSTPTPTAMGECIVKGSIFGGNNANGSPAGTSEVHIYKTKDYTDHLRTASNKLESATPSDHTYELLAVYGGGNLAAFNGTTTNVVIETCDPSIETVYGGGNAADATNTSVLVKGAYEIGTVFGGGNGLVTPANVSGTATTVLNGGRIHDFYGGSNSQGTVGTYSDNVSTGGPVITINDLQIGTDCSLKFDNIYGAGKSANVDGNISMTMGCLSDAFTIQNLYGGAQAADVKGDVTLTVTSGRFDRVFGGNNVSGTIGGNITVNLEETGCKPLIIGQVFGGGNQANFDHNTTVNAKSFTSIGEIYGGGNLADVAGNTSVNILTKLSDMNATDASVFAGQTVTIGDKSVTLPAHAKGEVGAIGYVYGGGFGASTNVNQNVEVTIGSTSDAAVNPIITGDVYGGSALGTVNGTTPTTDYHTYVTLNKGTVTGSVYGGGLGDVSNPAAVNGAVTVTVNGGKAANVFGCNNVNGSPQSTVAVIINGTEALSVAAPDIKNVYGGGNQAEYTYANAANPLQVTIKGGTIGNVFGGGLSANVAGSITVNIEGGKVFEDVYGGGALAHTNTANWNDDTYVLVPVVKDITCITGLYTKSGDVYTEITTADTRAPASSSDTYYQKGNWKTDHNTYNSTSKLYETKYKTTVNLTGGVIGNAYGGGLGREAKDAVPASGTPGTDGYVPAQPALSAVAAIVYGDVAVNVGNGSDAATGFIQEFETPSGSDMAVPISGRIFGCNNINGTPKGHVTVTVNNTQQLDGNGNLVAGHSDNKFDVHSVYGGGNQARYIPANGKDTKVIIDGCEKTSIEKVFGGGNSAAVPQTTVVILGSHRIGYAFGGGNGADMIKKGSTWVDNDGAPIYGDATVFAIGGKIGMTFAGSDTKGVVYGTATTKLKGMIIDGGEEYTGTEYTSTCPLKITHSYGAGRGAAIEGDVNFIVSGCTDTQIETIFGGSYDANIRGNINLTITSGIYTQVFGGNDHGGTIGGDITVNIEESESCKPTIIQYLFGGGREAAYPGTGAKKKVDDGYEDVTRGKITVNVKSATRIDNVYGGGWRALINGDTEVNINMIKGLWAGRSDCILPDGYRGNPIPNSNMTVSYQAIPAEGITVGTTSVLGWYTYDDDTKEYTQITDQNKKAEENVTYYEAKTTGAITIFNEIGTIGNIYGGSYQSENHGNATVNIGTKQQIAIMKRVNGTIVDNADPPVSIYDPETKKIREGVVIGEDWHDVEGAHITGNVYGGGDLATMDKYESGKDEQDKPTYAGGNTFVNICAVETSPGSGTFNAVSYGTVTIEGNVYGGGRGLADNFFCRSGMVGHEGDNVGQDPDTKDGTTVRIGNGTVNGSVYGGGEIARVEWSSDVTVGLATGVTSAPIIEGSVFGGGKGVSTHGYSALLRGDTHVTVQADAKVKKSVYGGGEIASVGRYNVATAENAATYGVEPGMPYSLFDARTGQCHVTVQGNAVIGPDAAMTMPDFFGNVFGGGKGMLPYEGYAANENPWRMPPDNSKQYYPRSTQKAAYLKYVETLALATRTFVTIDGDAFIKGSVYGGSEEGIVQQNTLVKIKGGQIGCGKNTTDRHPSTVWDIVTPADNNPDYECASWPYEAPYDTYDMYAGTTGYDSKGGATTGTDGHTYYGNVFGGGCGKDPYEPGEWHTRAGAVGGNTRIEISGGHILTNVYGGNELTNVGTDGVDTTGVCIITMSGGTLGVPRTLDQIKNHPVTCYLFGGGKGDQRALFNKKTNVRDVVVSVTDGTIYGSVFGGGEDGHVMRDVTMTIGNTDGTGPKIGTWGTSYVDGNVFGGGRGFAGDAYTAGNVAGSIDLTIKGGTMLGSIYGGGRLGSVGYGLYDATTNGSPTPGYGEMRDDDKLDNGNTTTFYNSRIANWHNLGRGRGHVNVNISGGTIGNDYEFEYIAPETTIDDSYRSTNHVPYTLFDTDNRLLRTKGGNVFAGGMGRRTKLNGAPLSLTTDGINWHKLGNVKSTKLTISGTPWIKGSVYGGGEFGAVTGSRAVLEESTPVLDAENNAISAGTEIVISGGTIGTMMQQGVAANTVTSTTTGSGDNRYTFGSVYGGGYGTEDEVTDDPATPAVETPNPLETDVNKFGAYVNKNTYINMTAGAVRASVYGGGEMACVKGNTYVNVGGGTIGVGEVRAATTDGGPKDYVLFGGYRIGNVYGGGKGSTNAVYLGLVMGNTNVNISGGNVYHNVYGGGAYGSVGTFTPTTGVPSAWASGGKATVTVTGGTIGINGWNNGMVYGSGRGDVSAAAGSDPYDKLAWVNNSVVTIGTSGAGPAIKGSVYGGGENGHNFADATVNVLGGTIGVAPDGLTITTRGNVFGAGCGTDTYTESGKQRHNAMAGIVRGNTTVHVSGGQVYNSVYGGGSMGSVGTITNFFDLDNSSYTYKHSTESTDGKGTLYDFGLSWPYEFTYAAGTGLATVTVDGTAVVDGWVFGSAKGTVDDGISDISQQRYAEAKLANVRATLVTIGTSGGSAAAPTINQSVYGGGEDGHVYEDASVTIHHGTIARSVFGGGKGDGQFKTTLWEATGTDANPTHNELPNMDAYSWTAGRVYGNATVTMNGGSVGWFIYGGGNMGSVGKGNYSGGSDDYATGGYGELPSADGKLWTTAYTEQNPTKDLPWHFLNSGTATVNLFGGTVGNGSGTDDDGIPHGSIFGGSRGKAAASCKRSPRYKYVPDFFLGYVNKAIINIGGTITNDAVTEATGDGPEIYGSVYGGGQDGHVRNSTEVRIFKGKVKGLTTDASGRSGNVFGAGSGIGTYNDGGVYKVNNSSGSVTCTTLVEVYGDDDKGESTNKTVIKGNVYGGGALASVGPPKTPAQSSDEQKAGSSDHASYSYTRVNIKGGSVGGSVFGASRGPGDSYLATNPKFDTTSGSYDQTKYATDIWSYAYVSGGRIAGNVYGGGEGGIVKRDTEVHLTGGTIGSDTGGGDAYGGGKGTDNIAADVNGNTLVELNNNAGATAVDPSKKGCILKRVFGCNDFKGTPKGHALVQVYATQHKDKETMAKTSKFTPPSYDPDRLKNTDNTDEEYKVYLRRVINAAHIDNDPSKGILTGVNASVVSAAEAVYTNVSGTAESSLTPEQKASILTAAKNVNKAIGYLYDVEAVYGGGNLAMYKPDDDDDYAEVIIDGCDYTSIKQVYGGGNAASTPATYITVNAAYVIDEVFGGGNGADNYLHPIDGTWYANPGANVGYISTSEHEVDSSVDSPGTEDKPYYKAVVKPNADTKVGRQNPKNGFMYGSGITTTQIHGGTIHRVYGGSNKKGNIRVEARSRAEASGDCEMHVDETYGAGKSAEIDGKVNQNIECASGIEEIYGGSKNSDVNSDIHLKITNGSSLKRVFGGNNTSGKVNGTITVEIKEGGCEPIHIQELYAGGYLAAYSIYGYKNIGTIAAPNWQPRKKEDWEAMTAEEKTAEGLTTPRKDPVINVISASRIDNIFGGGYQATVVGDPHINVNMEEGKVIVEKKEKTAQDDTNLILTDGEKKYVFRDATGKYYDPDDVKAGNAVTLDIGTIGTIYGGGNQADIWGNTYVDIGTGEWLNLSRQREMLGTTTTITTPTTFTYKKLNEEDPSEQWTYVDNADPEHPVTRGIGANRPTPTRHAATITGNVFGGGKGLEDEFYCKKGMVGEDGKGANEDFSDNVDYKDGNTNVTIAHGTVRGNVYGGGEVGRVEKNSMVTIGKEDGTGSPEILGDVFGGGKGKETHGYSALLRGNPTVIIQGTAKVRGSVYGGGEVASVARYKVVNGTPVALANNTSGYCKVIVRGHAEIGPDNMQMKKEDGEGNPLPPDDKGHVFGAGKGVLPNVYDYKTQAVYEAEEHTEPYDPDKHRPKRMLAAVMPLMDNESSTWEYSDAPHENKWEYFGSDKTYHSFIETLALSSNTDVTISDNAFIKGSVYGGSENGIVQYDTHVTIKDNCQIGCGKGKTEPYSEELWTQALAADDYAKLAAIEPLMPECAHWDYVNTSAAPYDPFAKYKLTVDGKDKYYYDEEHKDYADGGSNIAKDGHSYYGNVFGGGSGVIPYAPGLWHRAAGQVRGNTVVDITGGHILTCVYGGNEHTDVGTYDKDTGNNNDPIIPKSGGKCTVNMVGGTVGVPRTPSQIAAFPFPGYLFGSGKGDQRIFFNTWTNVTNTEVNITGNARIYGSVFGGGEDGHVIENAKTTIGGNVTIGTMPYSHPTTITDKTPGVVIGTTGTSYVDGNVFGAGRGYSGEALTAGSIGGNVDVNILGGKMLGSIYGGGRLASVGIGFNTVSDASYGQFQEDEDAIAATHYTDSEASDYNTAHSLTPGAEGSVKEGDVKTPAIPAKPHGHVTVNITGGTIGNETESLALVKHTKGGNVFGGSMGRLELLDGTTPNPMWPQLGQVKTSAINISGTAVIKSNVYGGGEMGTVRDSSSVTIGGERNADGTVTVLGGGTVGRDVYGGGYGSNIFANNYKAIVEAAGENNTTLYFGYTPMQWAGCVGIESNVTICGGRVKKSVYGGGEMASVGIINYLLTKDAASIADDEVEFSHTSGESPTYTKYSNIVKHYDEHDSFVLSWPYEFSYIPGYDGKTKVTITGGRIGLTEAENDANPFAVDDKDNGDVYGAGKGIAGDYKDYLFCANVGSSEININFTSDATTLDSVNYVNGGDCIAGAVYGGGENGHVMGNTKVTLTNGLIGHSLYGGGSGKSKFTNTMLKLGKEKGSEDEEDYYTRDIYSITAGKVFGNTSVEMSGGYVVRSIYGGGTLGSVGKGNYAGGSDDYYSAGYGETLNGNLWTSAYDPDDEDSKKDNAWHFLNSGKCTVKITGGTVGFVDASDPTKSVKDGLPYGNVFGGCRGEAAPNITDSPRYLYCPEFFLGYANETEVIIGDTTRLDDPDYKGPKIMGSVYGGGQDGHVRRDAHVIIGKGEIGLPYAGSGIADLDNPQWLHRGNVYGAGSGISKYKYDLNYNDRHTKEVGQSEEVEANIEEVDYTNPSSGKVSKMKEIDYSTSAGSVTRYTQVDILGGTIHRNVYGGGSLASVGPPTIPPTRTELAYKPGVTTRDAAYGGGTIGEGWWSQNTVNIWGTIGTPTEYQSHYGGEVYGASRGLSAESTLGAVVWTLVKVYHGATIQGNVFGGGDAGMVKRDTEVIIGEERIVTSSDPEDDDDGGDTPPAGDGD